ncbi:uronyl 2-sulfotransferase-like [Vespa mandarinia]|uniref:uronyl 2-sulfotransferase-like n=1 Tax=Vespa mandarinia TaxID=7446 RepID=UPI00161D7C73|nr:uronyl 2-sulfotransferase-like [Vespa mandarinia]XP_046819174.1 uronyl 2-sulfotransferase-like [Vespa crabro]
MRVHRGFLPGLFVGVTLVFVLLNSRSSTVTLNSSVDVTIEPRDFDRKDDTRFVGNYAFNINKTYRYVTPSLAELGGRGNLPEMNKHVLMLTRVPGAGAELLVLILQRLQGYNAFKHIRLPAGDSGLLTTLQQELLVEEITSIIRQEAIPLSFDGDIRFLNFSEFGRQAPTFLALARDPLDPRALHRYRKGGMAAVLYRGTISHFCGQDPRCSKRNNKWALQRAKANVVRWYPVVGLLDYMKETLHVLQKEFPYFFTGSLRIYNKLRPKENYLSKRSINLKARAKKVLEEIMADEVEFYKWLKFRLLNQTSNNG